jgi:prevent-host-death family protein
MDDTDSYSTYEAKARFSEILRRVREGRTITVTYQGEPVAEIRPLDRAGGTAARMKWLRSRGTLSGAPRRQHKLAAVAKRPGALQRFLQDRNA